MTHAFRALTRGVSAIALFLNINTAFSQTSPEQSAEKPLEIVVTPNRSPTAIQRTGSAVSVVPAEAIASSNPASLADALRSVPGLDVSEAGQPGSPLNVRIRGANAGHTLVLLDGVRISDPSQGSGEFDFSALAPGLIDRIEVLRGPQSALYGSDAMGGVVNIITKKSRGPMQGYAQIEGGSYGTIGTKSGVYGTNGPWSYSLAASALKSEGFSSYGYRIGRINATSPTLEKDGMDRLGGFGRIGYDPGTGFRFETGLISTRTRADYDAGFAPTPDTASVSTQRLTQGWARAEFDSFDQRLLNRLTLFSSYATRNFTNIYGVTLPPVTSFTDRYDFIGKRIGVEYQGDLSLNSFGKLSFGGKFERESIVSYTEFVAPFPAPRTKDIDTSQSTRSVFALWQYRLGDRTDLSLGGRYDDVIDTVQFLTWRATAAHRILETNTKLRASIGTGGKAPTLYQLYAPIFGNANLQPERSFGMDAGIDQSILDGRATLSLTGFYNTFRDLIDYRATGPLTGNYFNVARAKTTGIEVGLDATLIEDYLKARAAYTFMRAKDLDTHLTLARRPEHLAKFSLAMTPNSKWTIEPRVTLYGARFSSPGETDRLAPYARFDIHTNYKLDATWTLHARAENITNARYQDVLNYGTTGRAVYGGLKATW